MNETRSHTDEPNSRPVIHRIKPEKILPGNFSIEDTDDEPIAEGAVRADILDYRGVGRKESPFLAIDTWPSLQKAVNDFTASGWDEDNRTLMQNCHVMADLATGQILAIGAYVRSKKSEKPVLVWIFTETAKAVVRSYEIEYAPHMAQRRDR